MARKTTKTTKTAPQANRPAKSRRKRAEQAAPRRKPVKPDIGPSVTADDKATFVSQPLEQPPIKQTSSWRLIAPSAQLWFRNYDTCIVILLLPSLLFLLGSLLAPDLTRINNTTLAGVLLATLAFIWQLVNVPIAYYLQVRAIHGDRPGVRETYREGFKFVLRLIGLFAMIVLLAIGGLLLLVVPGIIVLRRYLLAPYYLIDRNVGIREAMRQSAADSKSSAQYIWGIYGVYMLYTVVCLILFIQIFPPFGSAVSAFLTSLFVFGPALRYKEVALRKPAVAPEEI